MSHPRHLGSSRVDLAPTANVVMFSVSFLSLYSGYYLPLLLFILHAPLTSALWPLPASYEHGEGVVWLDRHLTFQYAITNQVRDLRTLVV